jgi:cellulose synthase/poly-beta-1,6-N-acetylglucosamine synthase-like glycosyltransferase
MEAAFWICLSGVAYAYFGYPAVLMFLGWLKDLFSDKEQPCFSRDEAPSVSVLIPAHNEAEVIASKLINTLSLYYPGDLEIMVISDGSIDNTADVVQTFSDDKRLTFINLDERKGKANALNVGLEKARGDIIVFSDASIILDEQALWCITQPFADSRIGCVSGEDMIQGSGGEGLYGRYELYLRNQESRLGSIVGASGSFYAQRKQLVNPFLEGVAPDFLSVLNTVERGYRAISTPSAFGYMSAVVSTRDEFQRKVRTLIRGMTALFGKKILLNPYRYPMFSFFLVSHKLMRWWVPFFLLGMLLANMFLIDEPFYLIFLVLQCGFYALAVLGYLGLRTVSDSLPGKISLYFSLVNVAIFIAWIRYFSGFRQEIWTPSQRVG